MSLSNKEVEGVKHALLRDSGLMNHEKSNQGHDKQVIGMTY